MGLVVQKYGGTLLRTEADRRDVSREVARRRSRGDSVVVVASAMGRAGDAYATDSLLALVGGGGFIDAAARDLLLSCGESIAVVVLSHHMREVGVEAVPLTGGMAGILTSGQAGSAHVVEVETSRLRKLLEADRVPVVAGFQGISPTGAVTTLGRGGSDITAVALGAALEADLVEIVKDVDGVMSADPTLVPSARRVGSMSYDELATLTWLGSRVVHARAAVMAKRYGIRLRVRRLDVEEGTSVIGAADPRVRLLDGCQVVAVAHRAGLGLVELRGLQPSPNPVLDTLRSLWCEVPACESVWAGGDRLSLRLPYEHAVAFADRFPAAELNGPLDLVAAIGSGFDEDNTLLGDMLSALAAAGIAVWAVTQSGSAITFLVSPEDGVCAVEVLHDFVRPRE
jgi:aspartate kinase